MKVDWSPLAEDGIFDASCHMRDLFETKVECTDPWPMYSYSRPAYMVWNAIGQVMVDKGYTVEQIKEWMQSKNPRHDLDGSLGDMIAEATTKWAKEHLGPPETE
jgi:hypothetical protein